MESLASSRRCRAVLPSPGSGDVGPDSTDEHVFLLPGSPTVDCRVPTNLTLRSQSPRLLPELPLHAQLLIGRPQPSIPLAFKFCLITFYNRVIHLL